jgi:hypothetical protein
LQLECQHIETTDFGVRSDFHGVLWRRIHSTHLICASLP